MHILDASTNLIKKGVTMKTSTQVKLSTLLNKVSNKKIEEITGQVTSQQILDNDTILSRLTILVLISLNLEFTYDERILYNSSTIEQKIEILFGKQQYANKKRKTTK
jgi:hypothetical protein